MKTRRDVLKAAALTSLATACGRTVLPGAGEGEVSADAPFRWERGAAPEPVVKVHEDPAAMMPSQAFPLGVSSGDVAGARAVVQCKYTGTEPLELRLWTEDGERVQTRAVTVVDGFAHVDLEGLSQDTAYSYAFVEVGEHVARSGVGRFRSALGDDALEPMVLGAVSCTDIPNDLSALDHAGRRTDLRAFMLLGDTTYADGSSSLDDYRDKWAQSIRRPQYVALRQSVPLLATWDDHEVSNDWNPETFSASKLANARAAFFEHLPLRRDPMEPDRVWKSVRLGRTAEVFVLDSRSERKPSTLLAGGTTYISERQLQWLKDGLAASPCTFKVIMNSVPITLFPFSAFNIDSWGAYTAQRKDLLEFIDANVRGVLWVSGDHHFASMGRVSPTGPGSQQIEVLAGPGAQDSSPLSAACVPPQFDWGSGDNNYLAIHLEPMTREARLVFWGRDGQVIKEKSYTLS